MLLSRRDFLLTAGAIVPGGAFAANEWPQFRGVGARGVAEDDPRLPETWSATENVVWKSPVAGEGWSSPVVWGDRIYLATCVSSAGTAPPEGGLYDGLLSDAIPSDEHEWIVTCTDFESGERLWETVVHRGAPQVSRHKKNTYASETTVTDGEHVWAHFGDLGTYCLDMDGDVVWSKSWPDVETRYGYGTASSPTLHEGRLYIVNDNEGQSYLLALDKVTGREIWRVDRDTANFTASPWGYNGRVFCLNEDGDTFVIEAGPEFKVLARNSLGDMALATPAIANGSLIVRTYSTLWRISQQA